MPTVVEWNDLLVTLLGVLIASLVAVIVYIFNRHSQKIDEVDRTNKEEHEICNQKFTRLTEELHRVKEELPKSYVTKEDFQRFEVNITKYFSDLNNGISDLRGDITNLMRNKQDK